MMQLIFCNIISIVQIEVVNIETTSTYTTVHENNIGAPKMQNIFDRAEGHDFLSQFFVNLISFPSSLFFWREEKRGKE